MSVTPPEPFITPNSVAQPGTAGMNVNDYGFGSAGTYAGGKDASGVIHVNAGNAVNGNPYGANYRGDQGPTAFWAGTSVTPQLVDSTVLESQLQSWFYTPELKPKYDAVLVQMQQAGYPHVQGPNPTLADALADYQQVLLGASYNLQYTPEQYLQRAAATHQFASETQGPQTTISTTSNTSNVNDSRTDLTGPLDAKALVTSAIGQYLGRMPTPQEQAGFLRLLNEQETKNPTLTTGVQSSTGGTTTTSTPPGNGHPGTAGGSTLVNSATTSNQNNDLTTSGGIDGPGTAQLATDYAKARPDYAPTQMNTTLMGWLQEAILKPAAGKAI